MNCTYARRLCDDGRFLGRYLHVNIGLTEPYFLKHNPIFLKENAL